MLFYLEMPSDYCEDDWILDYFFTSRLGPTYYFALVIFDKL
jgi:hypothetical protein